MNMFSGTIKSATKQMFLNQKWMQKKETGELFTKKERNQNANKTQEERMLDMFKQQMMQEKESKYKNDISNKIMSGATLTPDEIRYLEQNDPASLDSYRKMQAEKKAYAEKLRNCKTKDEVQRVKMDKMAEFAAKMKKAESNPCIPASEKAAIAMEIIAKTKVIQEVEEKFMQTTQYAKLPKEADIAKEKAKEESLRNEQINEEIKEAAEESEEENPSIPEESEEIVSDKGDKAAKDTEPAKKEDVQRGQKESEIGRDDKDVYKKSVKKEWTPKDVEELCAHVLFQVSLETGSGLEKTAGTGEGHVGQNLDFSI